MPEHVCRPLREGDVNLIHKSWLMAYICVDEDHPHGQAPLCKMHNAEYRFYQSDLIKLLMQRSNILVCCNPDDEDQIFGWICVENENVLHFVNVRKPFRGFKIATTLLEKAVADFRRKEFPFTHFTPQMNQLSKKWNARFNPYLVFMPQRGPKII
jgi:hypothetical protein